jgi:hypothetical protein
MLAQHTLGARQLLSSGLLRRDEHLSHFSPQEFFSEVSATRNAAEMRFETAGCVQQYSHVSQSLHCVCVWHSARRLLAVGTQLHAHTAVLNSTGFQFRYVLLDPFPPADALAPQNEPQWAASAAVPIQITKR